MIGPHLPGTDSRHLGSKNLEVGSQVARHLRKRIGLVGEAVSHQFRRGRRSADVVAQTHEGNAVPVLGLTPGMRRRGLGRKKPGRIPDVHPGAPIDALDPGVQLAYLHVARCETGVAELQSFQVVARVERDRRLAGSSRRSASNSNLTTAAPGALPATQRQDRPSSGTNRASRSAPLRRIVFATRERGGGSPGTNNLSKMLGGLLAAHAHSAQVRIHAGPRSDAQAVQRRGEPSGRHRGKWTQG